MYTCGECKHFSPGTTTYDEIIGEIHVCNKGSICNSWNLNNNCKDFSLDDKVFYKEGRRSKQK